MSFTKKLEAVQELLNDLKEKVGADDGGDLVQDVQDLSTRMEEAEEQLSTLDGRCDDLDNELENKVSADDIDSLRETVDEVSEANSQLVCEVRELKSYNSALTEALNQLSLRLTALESKVATPVG